MSISNNMCSAAGFDGGLEKLLTAVCAACKRRACVAAGKRPAEWGDPGPPLLCGGWLSVWPRLAAGLSAARQLRNHGYKVVVLEGADRPGGRVHTHRLEVRLPPAHTQSGQLAWHSFGCALLVL